MEMIGPLLLVIGGALSIIGSTVLGPLAVLIGWLVIALGVVVMLLVGRHERQKSQAPENPYRENGNHPPTQEQLVGQYLGALMCAEVLNFSP